jgi:hypothetical protein
MPEMMLLWAPLPSELNTCTDRVHEFRSDPKLGDTCGPRVYTCPIFHCVDTT